MSAARGGKSGGGKRTDEDGDGASASASATRRVFVTVGTTMFADLVRAVTSDDALRALRARGVSHLVVQYGRGDWPGDAPVLGSQQHGIQVSGYALKPSTEADVAAAWLVVCHGGAGSIFDALRAGKPVVVVPNTTLMDNHQLDLARALHEAGNVALCTPSELAATLKSVDVGALKRVPAANSAGFRRCIDACCGVTKQD